MVTRGIRLNPVDLRNLYDGSPKLGWTALMAIKAEGEWTQQKESGCPPAACSYSEAVMPGVRYSPYARNVSIGRPGLGGTLVSPAGAKGIVVFAHGSGSSRFSPRNIEVAEALNARGLATLLFDLLTPTEAEVRAKVFDIGLLAARVIEAVAWVRAAPPVASLPVGLFGASTGAAAALVAASQDHVAAVVSRGGRPDLAGEALRRVAAPTLLIVGGDDTGVIELNRQALDELRCEKRLEIVPGATHLFEEPGTMQRVTSLAADWFAQHLEGRTP